MYQNKSRVQMFLVILTDYLGIIGSIFLSNYIRIYVLNGESAREDQLYVMLGACLVVHTAQLLFRNKYTDFNVRGYLKEFIATFQINMVIILGATVLMYLTRSFNEFPRTIYLISFALNFVIMYVMHVIWKALIPKVYKKVVDRRQLLIITDKAMLEDIVSDIRRMKDYSYKMMGIILTDATSDDIGNEYHGVKVVSGIEGAAEYCQKAAIDEAMVATRGNEEEQVMALMNILSMMGVTVHYNIKAFYLDGANSHTISTFGDYYTVTYINRSISFGKLMIKRIMDILGGLVGSLICLLLAIIFGPIIKIQSPGPIFFKQDRVGRNGRIFKIYKFRSMYMDAEARKKELMADNEMDADGLMFKMEDDPRITPIGRFIRKTSIDEFPQFFNILKGDMSLVGTRPPTVDEFEKYRPEHKKRLSFKPGLTGMWQVSGRNDITDFDQVVKLDVEYINNWSIYLDIKIILRTILVAFKGK